MALSGAPKRRSPLEACTSGAPARMKPKEGRKMNHTATSTALAQQPVQPLPKVGGCQLGFYSSGRYCVISHSNDREAIQKSGKGCPLGWYSSGGYCVKSR